MLKTICVVLILIEACNSIKKKQNEMTGIRYTECPCMEDDKEADFAKKTGLWYMLYGFGFPEFICVTMEFTNEDEGVSGRNFQATNKGNDTHIQWHGNNYQIENDRFFAYDANNDKLQYSITFYHDYDLNTGCIGILCCLLYDPNSWQTLFFCRSPKKNATKVNDHVVKMQKILEEKYQPKLPEKMDLFEIDHPESCDYNKLITRSLPNGEPDYQSINVVALRKMYKKLAKTKVV